MTISINHVNELDKKSSWRITQRLIVTATKNGWDEEKIKKLKRTRAQTDFLTFAELMTDGALIVKDFHELIASVFQDLAYRRYHRAIISAPPRAGKSFLAALFIAWLVGLNDDANHILASYGFSLTNKLYKSVMSFIVHKEFAKIFPNWRGIEKGTKATFNSKGVILPTSVGGPLTGFTSGTLAQVKDPYQPGVGALLIDDPLKSGYSAAALRELEDWWQTQASTRRTMDWCQLLIGTRFHTNDLHGQLLKADGLYHPEKNPLGWRWLNIQALCEDSFTDVLGRSNGESLWEDNPIFTRELLENQKKAMGVNNFSAMYQGFPVAAEGCVFDPNYIKIIEKENAVLRTDYYLSADTAYGEKEENDPTVLTVFAVSPAADNDIHIVEQISGSWGFPELQRRVRAAAARYNIKAFICEEKATGTPLLQVLESSTSIPTVGMKALKDKSIRLQQVLPLFEENRVLFYNGAWNKNLIDELTNFPYAIHDDAMDSLVYALLFFQLEIDSFYRSHVITQQQSWLNNTVNYRTAPPMKPGQEFLKGRNARTHTKDYSNFFN